MSENAQGADTKPDTTPQGGTTQQPAQQQAVPLDMAEAVRRGLESLMNKAGSPDRAAEILYDDNKKLRDKARELESQAKAAQEEAEKLAAWRALGEDPKAIAEELSQGRAALEREHARALADVSGANPRVLADRLKLDGLSASVKDVKEDGKDVKRVHVFKNGEDQGELRAYAEAHWQDFLPALFPPNPKRAGVPALPQVGGGAEQGEVNPFAAALGRTGPQGEKRVSAFDFGGMK